MLKPNHRIGLFMERAFEDQTGKMGLGVLRYSENPIVCMIDSANAGFDGRKLSGVDRECAVVATVDDAKALGVEVLVLGIAPPGGLVPSDWWPALDRAVEIGMSLVNGLHDKLGPRYPRLAKDQFVWDVRTEPSGIGVGTAAARLLPGRRVLMVGTDMSVGKMTAGLEIVKSAKAEGIDTAFVATGQTGIVISGDGVPLDAVRLDYASGAIESEVCKYSESKLIVIEGQGSLLHPGSSATLPLMRGSCPTHLILCHRAGMIELPKIEWIKVPPLSEVIRLLESLASACGTYPSARVVGIALNTGHLDDAEAMETVNQMEIELGLPVCDPVRTSAKKLLEAVMA